MEDFRSVVVERESSQENPLFAELVSSSITERAAFKGDKTQPKAQGDGPGKDVADRIDGELKEFVDKLPAGSSKNMTAFSAMVATFNGAADKSKAMETFGENYSRWNVSLEKEISQKFDERDAEGNAQPGRAALKATADGAQRTFFDSVYALPSSEEHQVMDLLGWTDGETQDAHRARVREGLKGKPAILNAYNAMESADDKVEANKSAKEIALDQEIRTAQLDYHAAHRVANKVYIRSTIPF